MRHQLSTARRRRLLFGSLSAIGFVGALVAQTSCARLKGTNTENSGTGNTNTTTGTTTSTNTGTSVSTSTGTGGSEAAEPKLSNLEMGETVLDGGLPEAGKTACTDSLEQLSHTRGILPDGGLLDISQATGYTPNPGIPTQANQLLGISGGTVNTTSLANQMRGTPSISGGMLSFNDIYRTLDDPNTMIKGILFRDGPRGVNLSSPVYLGAFGSPPQNLGNAYATVFPVSAARAATWDLDLEAQVGEDLADEILATGNNLTISPCVNILRNPAWGRSQETYGEDSFAIGRMGTAYVDGVQTFVPACVKHLAAYNIEDGRFSQNSVMDSQTLHEIYGRHFEMIVQEGGVACVMASYNSIQVSDLDNVSYKDTSNPILLDGMLKTTFGFKGFVMSDFWAMPGYQSTSLMASQYGANALAAVSAGLDLEMPWDLNFQSIESVATSSQLEDSALRIVQQKLRFNMAQAGVPGQKEGLNPPTSSINSNGITNNQNHLADAERQAEEAMVLLKNENNVLPIDPTTVKTVAVIGANIPYNLSGTGQSGTVDFATDIRIGDLGSSRVIPDPSTTVGPLAGIQAAAAAHGGINVVTSNDASAAANADFVVVVAGLTPEDEGEEYTGAGDRVSGSNNQPNYNLECKRGTTVQNDLITAIAGMGKPMVVVLEGGSAIDMPWLDMVPAVVMAWYPGEQGGTALGRLLFGDVNFSGKLPITWPKSEADEPPFNQGSSAMGAGSGTGGSTTMGYYLGYRWFDEQKITPLFAYGSGLSYTTFQYDGMNVPCSTVTQHGVVDVQVAVTNTGTVAGNETTFLFVSYPNTTARRSVKELKGFHRTKQPIQPGQTVMFTIPLRVQDLKYWNSAANATGNPPGQWTVEAGTVNIMVGPSSDNLPLTDSITVTATQ